MLRKDLLSFFGLELFFCSISIKETFLPTIGKRGPGFGLAIRAVFLVAGLVVFGALFFAAFLEAFFATVFLAVGFFLADETFFTTFLTVFFFERGFLGVAAFLVRTFLAVFFLGMRAVCSRPTAYLCQPKKM
ncbi:MAG: hypothetical protein AAF649_01585 [Verrucomicrobiota bacterium]